MLLLPTPPVVTFTALPIPEAVKVLEVDLRGASATPPIETTWSVDRGQIDPHHMVARDDSTEDQRVAACPGIDRINIAGRDQHGDPVVARTSVDAVLTQAAVQRVVAQATCHGVVTGPAIDEVVAVLSR